ncbi:erythromycin esterase family protein [Streptomyces sp. NPDC058374]|uniref:erythromycin esterase family protein n=1 Tax=Streptomyces sp. NPDC058374 TaxID=3346466 RepID=UPI003646A912
MDTSTAQIVQWLGARAHPLNAADTQAPSGDLAAFVSLVRDRGAEVVAVGVACRQGRELAVVAHRMVRVPVEEAGFRSVASEGDDPVAVGIDGYVRTGEGGPRAMPAGARLFWRSEEILGLVEWMRAYNLRNPADQVRFARPSPGGERGPRLAGTAGIERELAEDTLGWCRRSGDKIVYWGGLAHMAVGEPRGGGAPAPGRGPHHPSTGPSVIRDPVLAFLTRPRPAALIDGMLTRLDLTQRRHVDLARVSSSACRPRG